ncbi:MAG: thiol peroxidase [Bacteroidia bacterium]|nr:thiol peroxidase [Bacteroidia bacterium]
MSLDSTKLKGHPVSLLDALPEVGENAFDFTFVKPDLSEGSLYDFEGKIRVLIGVPSLDTGVCAKEAREFNKRLEGMKDKGVVGFVISKDTPFAMRRFCELEGIQNVIAASDFRYTDFTREYGTEMISGALKGLSARVIFIIDQQNKIRYVQLVPEVTDEPDYDAVLKALEAINKA